jgi:hypothetical protein
MGIHRDVVGSRRSHYTGAGKRDQCPLQSTHISMGSTYLLHGQADETSQVRAGFVKLHEHWIGEAWVRHQLEHVRCVPAALTSPCLVSTRWCYSSMSTWPNAAGSNERAAACRDTSLMHTTGGRRLSPHHRDLSIANNPQHDRIDQEHRRESATSHPIRQQELALTSPLSL